MRPFDQGLLPPLSTQVDTDVIHVINVPRTVGKPENKARCYPDFVNLFTHPHIALGAVSEEEEEEECEANPCTITETELKTVEWVQCDGCARWYHLDFNLKP